MVAATTIAAVFIVWLANRPGEPEKNRPAAPPPTASPPKAPAGQPEEESTVFARYAGSESCRPCHADQFGKWQGSHHQLAERLPEPGMDRGAFEPKREFNHPAAASEMHAEGDRFHITTRGLSGERETFAVERVIGETPLRQYLVQFPRGLLQAVDLSHDPQNDEWFNVFGDEERQPGEWGHWTGRGMNWNTQCASCHNTRLRKNHDETTDSYQTTMAERSVGCEACHGPMKAHVDWRLQHPDSTAPDPTVRRLDNAFGFSVRNHIELS